MRLLDESPSTPEDRKEGLLPAQILSRCDGMCMQARVLLSIFHRGALGKIGRGAVV